MKKTSLKFNLAMVAWYVLEVITFVFRMFIMFFMGILFSITTILNFVNNWIADKVDSIKPKAEAEN